VNGPQLADYEGLAPEGSIELLRHLADELAGRTFIHVNTTKAGGGVAEILNRMVPLMEELGIRTRWEVIEGTPAYYEVTKQIHNTLQGARMRISDEMWDVYLETSRRAAQSMDLEADLVMIHDPQPAPLIETRTEGSHWIWRCHIDLSRPERTTWNFLAPFIRRYDGAVFHIADFVRQLPIPCYLIHPSIDPLSDKNRELDRDEVARRLETLGVPTDLPLLVQVSRFDRFKDPLGVIEAYRLVRRFDDCALVLAGGGAADDPEGAEVFARVQEAAAGDPNIHILMLPSDAHLDINALQRGATVVVQKSVREGFGLTVAEAMWKGKPVVGGAVGGIAEQIQDGVNGYLVHSIEGCAHAIRQLLGDRSRRHAMGEAAREQARRNALITRHLSDYLQMLLLRTTMATG
jgi:trehalose synthase